MKNEFIKSKLIINKIEMINKIIDYVCLSLMGILCVGFLIFYSDFAKLHIDLAILHVPLFVGDFVFIVCCCMFLFKWLINQKKLSGVSYLLMFYVLFIIAKTLWGYFYWGPLALRHAVLFSYPLLAVFFYSFYRRSFFTGKKSVLIILFLFFVFLFVKFHSYYVFGCFLLVFLLINKQSKFWLRLVLFAFLLTIFPYKLIFSSQRTFILSNVLIIIYIIIYLLVLFRVKVMYKILLCSLLLSLTIYGLVKYGNHNELKSIVAFEKLRRGYSGIMSNYRKKEVFFTPKELKIKIYNEGNSILTYSNFKYDQDMHRRLVYANFPRQKIKLDVARVDKVESEINKFDYLSKNETNVLTGYKPVVNMMERGIETPYSNSLFRIAIWLDSLRELRKELPVLGFDFGKLFRSRTLEVCDWGQTTWFFNGWVCLHNSYLDIIYRAGVVGILMIVGIFIVVIHLIIVTTKRRSIEGALLVGVLLNWIIAAFFMEILEMPYSAIPLWSLFGLTTAYLFRDRP